MILKLQKNNIKGILFILMLIVLSSCGSRKPTVKPNPNSASKIAYAMSHLKSKQLYRFINDWTGVRYRFGGLDKRGIDCSGFAFLLQKDIYGINLPRRSSDQATT